MVNYLSIDLLYVRCIYYYFKCVGLATMSVRFKSIIRNKKVPFLLFAPSKIGILPNLVFILVVLCTQYYTVKVAFEITVENHMKFDLMIETIRLIFGAGSSVFILLIFYTKQDTTINIASNLKKISVLSVNLSTKTVKQKESFLIYRATGSIFLAHIVIWLLIFITTPSNIDMLIYYISLNLFELVITSMFLQFSILLKIVRRILEIINANIFDIFGNTINIHTISTIENNGNEVKFKSKLRKLSQLKELHIAVCDVAQSLGRFYSISVLFCITYEFFSLTIYFYFLTKFLFGMYRDSITADVICFYALGILHYIVPLVDLIGSTSGVVGEGEKTVEIINRWIETMKNQQRTVRLNHFSNYLAQQKLKFSAGGLFSLDGTLLLSIAGSITTYIMILLQFEGI